MQADDETGVASSARLRAILDSLLDPHVRLEAVRDEAGRVVDLVYTDCNPAACDYFGLSREQLLGQQLLELFPEQETSGLFAVYAACLETGAPIKIRDAEIWSEVAHTFRWFDFSGARADGGITLTWRDVSAAHEAAAQLSDSERRYRLLAENTTDVVLQVSLDGTILWASSAAERTLAWSPGDLVGRRNIDLVHPDEREWLLAASRSAAASGEDSIFRFRLLRGDGDYEWMESAARTAEPGDGSAAFRVIRLRDVNAQVAAERALEAERDLLRATLDSMLDPHVVMTAVRDTSGAITDFTYVDANPPALTYLGGMTRERFVGMTLREMYPSDAATLLLAQYSHTVETGDPLVLDDYAYPNEMFGGVERRYDLRGAKVGDALSLSWRDVTPRHQLAEQLAESEERYRLLAENTTDVVLQVTLDGTILWASSAAQRTLGWDPDELVGRSFDLIHPDDRATTWSLVREAVEAGTPTTLTVRLLRGDGRYQWMEAAGRTAQPGGGKGAFGVLRLRDVEDEVRLRTELQHRARTDALTGLLTRREGWRRLGADLEERREGEDVGVLFVDLDGFKQVNDKHGHQAGDALLVALAARLQSAVREDDYVVRVGGDELFVVLNDVDGPQAALAVAEKVRAAVALPVSVDGEPVSVTASVGATIARPEDTVAEIVHRADRAMYRAKSAGRNQVATID